VPTNPTPGRSLVTRRAVVDVVRVATLGSYGVTGFAGGWIGAVQERLGLGQPGIDVTFGEPAPDGGARPDLTIDLAITVAYGLPIAEVARQVDSAVRYAIRGALAREIDRLVIHVDGLRVAAYDPRPMGGGRTRGVHDVATDDLAASGTDVA